MRASIPLVLLLVVMPTGAIAQVRQSWDYSDEERLAMRFDPGDVPNVIVGKRNPELFLPFELFTFLIQNAFDRDPANRNAAREHLTPYISGDASAFWRTLEQTSADYIADQAEEQTLIAQLNAAATHEEREDIRSRLSGQQPIRQCALRHAALVRATDAIGHASLYRVLYEGVAPGISTTSRDPDLRSHLSYVSEGCQR